MMMTNDFTTRRASTLWILLLTIASTVTTLALACATPFPALAALAAIHMKRRDGIALIGASWLASQVVGFCVLDYPRDASTFAWGAAIGLAALASVLVAGSAAKVVARHGYVAQLAAAYVGGFLAFKATIALASLGLGGAGIALSLPLMAEQFARNAAILVGLLALYRGLVAVGLPAAPAPRPLTA